MPSIQVDSGDDRTQLPNRVVADDEQVLVDRFRSGDVSAFEELYRRHRTAVHRRLTQLCGNEAVAEELTQETFLRAAQRIGTSGDMRFRAWVMRIGVNLSIDHLRALRRCPAQSIDSALESRLVGSGIIDTERQVEQREDVRFVAAVLDRLRPRHRRVLILREIEGYDYRSIAERMGISASAVETLLFRARARFREEYARAITD
ncbi:MAG: RNA polymerase sigma factor [Chloroflexi bacterium]|nr:MAG: RNA polymerase sigma factor [Chloroflexota bacterium]